MKAGHIQELLSALGCRRISGSDLKVRSTCPLGPWRHGGGKDEHPSFVVFAEENYHSKCKCLGAACNFKGSLTELLWAYEQHSKIRLDKYHRFITSNDQANLKGMLERAEGNLGIFKKFKMPGAVDGGMDHAEILKAAEQSNDLSNFVHCVDEMRGFMTDESRSYLNARRITDASIDEWRLGWHPRARRIAIPQYDKDNRLVNIGGRIIDPDDDPFWRQIPWMHAKGFKKELFLFGEDKFTSFDGKGTMVLVEGMFDAIYLYQEGVRNVAAMLGAHVNIPQYTKIVRWFDRLVIVPDGDPEGFKAADRIVEMFANKIPVVVYPMAQDKDPDEMTKSEIEDLIQNYLTIN